MRSEHSTTGDEWDLIYARHVYCCFARTGVAKKIKKASHRMDRAVKRSKIREGEQEYYAERLELD